jgi:hypothetical protein
MASPWFLALLASGVTAGLFLMARGFLGNRAAARIGDTAPPGSRHWPSARPS